jgi:hypothetical protein
MFAYVGLELLPTKYSEGGGREGYLGKFESFFKTFADV